MIFMPISMPGSALLPVIIITAVAKNLAQTLPETTTFSLGEDFPDLKIIDIRVVRQLGNAVELSWGRALRDSGLNWTYGVYFARDAEALGEPKLVTKQLHATISNLTHCSQYSFAVGVVNANTNPQPPRLTRTIGTLIDPLSPPENLQLEFIPEEHPCMMIKFSASCPTIADPLVYSVTVLERPPSLLMIFPLPPSTSPDLRTTLRVSHGKSYDVKVSTEAGGAKPSEMKSLKIPLFLQPHHMQVTSQPDGTFILYWRDPHVPHYVGPYYYEVHVHPGRGLSQGQEIFVINRPAFAFKGNFTKYTFRVGLRSVRGGFESELTDPVFKDVYGDAVTLDVDAATR